MKIIETLEKEIKPPARPLDPLRAAPRLSVGTPHVPAWLNEKHDHLGNSHHLCPIRLHGEVSKRASIDFSRKFQLPTEGGPYSFVRKNVIDTSLGPSPEL